jgi:hypothetical protein
MRNANFVFFTAFRRQEPNGVRVSPCRGAPAAF